MHCQTHSTANTPASALPTAQRYRFTTLDWIAACFVIATPLFIAYRLFCH